MSRHSPTSSPLRSAMAPSTMLSSFSSTYPNPLGRLFSSRDRRRSVTTPLPSFPTMLFSTSSRDILFGRLPRVRRIGRESREEVSGEGMGLARTSGPCVRVSTVKQTALQSSARNTLTIPLFLFLLCSNL